MLSNLFYHKQNSVPNFFFKLNSDVECVQTLEDLKVKINEVWPKISQKLKALRREESLVKILAQIDEGEKVNFYFYSFQISFLILKAMLKRNVLDH